MPTLNKYEIYEQECELLKSKGYEAKVFFYKTGGGEDENDYTLFVKNDDALLWDYITTKWRKCKYSNCTYENGFDYNNSEIINIKGPK